MKVFNKRYNPKVVLTVLALFATQILISCSKENGTEKVVTQGTKLIVNVLGITDITEVSAVKLKANTEGKALVKQGDIMPKEMISFKGFDAQVSLEKDDLRTTNVSIGDRVTSSLGSGQLMAAAMKTGVKYRLLIYKIDGTFVSSTQLLSGTAGEVYVEKGEKYNWYAVSYHNTDDIPTVNSANPELNVPEDTDLLYASGTVDIPAGAADGNVPLGVVFEHKFARIALELNTMGMFADMNSVGVSVSGATAATGTIDLKDGTLSNISSQPVNVDFSNFVNVDPLYGDRKVAYIYTAVEDPLSSLSVSINALDIKLDDGTNRVFTDLATTPSVFNFNLTPQLGGSYTARLNFIESPLTVGGVEWARQNIYYQGGHNPYRFHHTYAHTNQRNSYFSFRSAIPTEYGSFSTPADPCSLVYPAGVWRTAKRSDFSALPNPSGTTVPSYGSNVVGGNSLGYFEYNATGTAAPYPSNKLHFNFNGGSISTSLVANLIEVQLGATYGTNVQFWTSDVVLDLGILTVGAWNYNGKIVDPAIGSTYHAATIDNALISIGALGLNLITSNFKNVRCVRK